MNIRVLIVEDEGLIRWSLRQKFEERGYHVTAFPFSGKEALFSALAVIDFRATIVHRKIHLLQPRKV